MIVKTDDSRKAIEALVEIASDKKQFASDRVKAADILLLHLSYGPASAHVEDDGA